MPRGRVRGQEALFQTQNVLYCGDNLEVLRLYQRDETVDLVYLDPPFKRQASYNVLFKELSGRKAAGQIKAFADTWTWDESSQPTYEEVVEEAPERLARALRAFHGYLGPSGMLAYLVMMAPRLVELHRVLRPTGSLYLHCDPSNGHYLKVLLDAVFGPENFRTEIVWKRSSAHSDTKQGRRQHGWVHDLLFFYTKSGKWTWNPVHTPYSENYLKTEYRHQTPEGRWYKETDLTAAKPGGDTEYEWRVKRRAGARERWQPDIHEEFRNPLAGWEYRGVKPYKGRYWAFSKANLIEFAREGKLVHRETGMPRLMHFADEMPGISLQDVWTDIPPAAGGEALPYPTQKPRALLKRIIESSSSPGGVVLDPFCGCGTTVDAAQELGRRWVGIDITNKALTVVRGRLHSVYGPEIDKAYEVFWEPVSVEDAKALAERPRAFEEWAVRRVGGQGSGKRGADRGIDGRILFHDEPGGETKEIIISVKSGYIGPKDVRELDSVIRRERAAIGVLVTMREPTLEMRREASMAESYISVYWGSKHPGIQLMTVKQLVEQGKTVDYPRGDRVPAFLRLEAEIELSKSAPKEPRMR